MSMPKPPGIPADFTASDVLAPQFWVGRAERPAPGLDVACTKIAVDLQNMRHEGVDDAIRRSLETLREGTSADAAFVVFLDAAGKHIESVISARGHFAQCHPEALRGAAIESLPWLNSRNDHLKLSEFRDTASPRREQANDAGTLAELAIGAALLVALRIKDQPAGFFGLAYGLPRGGFDVNLQLLMKLLGTSLATGLERVRLASALARIEERNGLAELTAHDGLW
ncbi:MAG TPA: GAF domain-containing protein, partial [Steroidobacteraceae bacterium]